MNKVILTGNLTKTPELKQTQNGISFARFTVAVRRRYQKDGEQQADFVNCIAWRGAAEFLCRYFDKGSGIALCGNIQTNSWRGQDGQMNFSTIVVAEEINFNGAKRGGDGQSSPSEQSQSGGYAEQTRGEQQYMPEAGYKPKNDEFAYMDYDDEDLPF